MSNLIRISEIFGPTIQGEGALIGKPTVFVRTGGCDYRCVWCDTLYAVDSAYRHDWKPMTSNEIMAEVTSLSGGQPLTISLSGGNPATQPMGGFIKIANENGYPVAIETQGSVAQDWFADLDVLTLSPKPPSSEMKTDWDIFDECVNAAGSETEIALKIVIFDEDDYNYARDAAKRYPHLPLYLQPGNHKTEGESDVDGLNTRMQWLTARVLKDQWYGVQVLPQLHLMLWGNQRGV